MIATRDDAGHLFNGEADMNSLTVRIAAAFATLMFAADGHAASYKANRIDIQYVEPKSPAHQPVFQQLKERRVLERLRDFLSPIRLPRRLLLKTEGCDGVSNAWYEDNTVTVCYEYLDEVWQNVPKETTPAGVAPIDALIGPVLDVFLHEAGHAVFDMLQVPIFGREEDAADQFSAYIMLQFGKDDARRLIMGNAYQYKGDLQSSTVTLSLKKFADEHGTPVQRFYNVLCVAYGADKTLFADVIAKGYLPAERADGCEDEYQQVAFAFHKLIRPYIDRKLAKRIHKSWLPPVTTPPASRPAVQDGKPRQQ
jgi:hypothetical protein